MMKDMQKYFLKKCNTFSLLVRSNANNKTKHTFWTCGKCGVYFSACTTSDWFSRHCFASAGTFNHRLWFVCSSGAKVHSHSGLGENQGDVSRYEPSRETSDGSERVKSDEFESVFVRVCV